MGTWVNYKALREGVSFAQVLEDLGVETTVKGDQATGYCPLPGHRQRSEKRSKSFSVNLKRGIFQCFGCQAKGNVIEFFTLMEGLEPSDKGQFRQAALRLQARYLASVPRDDAEVSAQAKETPSEPTDKRPRVINDPLPFELKSLDPSHHYLRDRGLTPETVEHFGLGHCSRGMMAGRVVIPLHDQAGQMIGYAGRLVDDRKIDDDHPKYKLPGPRERDGKVYELHKSEFLFNAHRIVGPVESLIVVEGFFGAMWLHQAGYPNVVATMGASCSERQGALLAGLLRSSGHLLIMSDGDDAGQKHAVSVFSVVGAQRLVRWVRLEDGQQPEDYSDVALETLLGARTG